jgi:hypothetical protein
MNRWDELSDEARDAGIRENVIDLVVMLAALVLMAGTAALWNWGGP